MAKACCGRVTINAGTLIHRIEFAPVEIQGWAG